MLGKSEAIPVQNSYTPTPIPLTYTSNESPVLESITTKTDMTPRTTPEDHVQVPHVEVVRPAASVTDVVFLPSQLQTGFQPMAGASDVRRLDYGPGEVTRLDYAPEKDYYYNKFEPRYTPRPIRGRQRDRWVDVRFASRNFSCEL